MIFVTILGQYIVWHYGRAYADIFGVWRNFLWFFYHLFSLPTLTMTLFDRWRRLGEEKKHSGFNPGEYLSTFLVNIIMRCVGFLMKGTLIIIGMCAIVVTFFAGIILFCVWTLMPVLISVLFGGGLFLIIS